MFHIGLTGGIGAGKSSVAAELAELGAHIIDADAIARDLVAPHTAGLAAVVAEFGAEVLDPSGALDRARLGGVVFSDDDARQRLNDIIHPLVRSETQRRLEALPDDAVVVHDVPLIVENDLAADYDLVVVVGADEDTRVARLVADRGMTVEEARARMAAQASDAERRAVADVWIDNSGSRAELRQAVHDAWQQHIRPAIRQHGRVSG